MSKITTTSIVMLVVGIVIGAAIVGGWYYLYPSAPIEPEEPEEEEPLILGLYSPFTGPNAIAGKETRQGATLALEEWDYTVMGRPIQVVYVDTESDPEKAVRAFEDAISRDHVEVFCGGWHSSVAIAIMDVLAKYKIVSFGQGQSPVIIEKIVNDPDKYFVFLKSYPLAERFIEGYTESIKTAEETGIWKPVTHNVAFIVEDTDYGRGWSSAAEDGFKELGWETVSVDIVALGETDFYPTLAKYKSLEVSLVGIATTSPQTWPAITKQAREVELPALLICDGLAWAYNWYELCGDASDYTLDMQGLRFVTPEQKNFRERYIRKWGEEPSAVGGGIVGYDMMRVTLAVLDEAGTTDAERLIEVALSHDWEGAGVMMERYAWEPDTHEIKTGEGYFMYPVSQNFDGSGVVIWPENIKEDNLKIPPWVPQSP